MKALVVAGLVTVLSALTAQAKTLNERLGFSPQDKVLLIHIDDIGAYSAVAPAARDVLNFGLAKSVSGLTPAPAFEEALTDSKIVGEDFGVHITLTSEPRPTGWTPAAGSAAVPSLVDGKGHLLTSFWKLYMKADEADVRKEIEAQIQKALASGLRPTHLDTHVGTVFFKKAWFEHYLSLARKYRIAPMVPRWSKELKEQMGWLGTVMNFLVPGMLKKVGEAGFLQLDAIYILPFPKKDIGYEARRQKYVDILKNLKPGVSQIIIHPAGESSSPGEDVRLYEAKIFQEPAIADLIREQGIHLIGWKQIADVYPWDEVREPEL
jgi:predicted glycoside hydrolase/deacetylase ChbG (UPF0249 family)